MNFEYDGPVSETEEERANRRENAIRTVSELRDGMKTARAQMQPPLIMGPGCKIGCSPCSTWCLAKSCMLDAFERELVELGGTLDRPALTHDGVLYDADAGRA